MTQRAVAKMGSKVGEIMARLRLKKGLGVLGIDGQIGSILAETWEGKGQDVRSLMRLGIGYFCWKIDNAVDIRRRSNCAGL